MTIALLCAKSCGSFPQELQCVEFCTHFSVSGLYATDLNFANTPTSLSIRKTGKSALWGKKTLLAFGWHLAGQEESQPLKRFSQGVPPVSGNWASLDCVQLRPLTAFAERAPKSRDLVDWAACCALSRACSFFPHLGTVFHSSPREMATPEIPGGFSSGKRLECRWEVGGRGSSSDALCGEFFFHLDCMFTVGEGGDAIASPNGL